LFNFLKNLNKKGGDKDDDDDDGSYDEQPPSSELPNTKYGYNNQVNIITCT
jgi:hypothetical protein